MTLGRKWVRTLAIAIVAGFLGSAVDAATTAAFLNQPLSVRQLGFGQVGAGGTDLLRAWGNPAVLATRERRGEFAAVGASMLGGGESLFGAGFGWLQSPKWAFGAFLVSQGMSMSEVDFFGEETGDTVSVRGTALGIAVAYGSGNLRVGVLPKILDDEVAGKRGNSAAVDLGLVYDVGPVSLGGALRNVGAPVSRISDTDTWRESLPVEARIGVSGAILDVTCAVEYVSRDNNRSSTGAGVEYWPIAMLGLRAGLAGYRDGDRKATAGISVVLRQWGIDYAFNTHPVGFSHVMGVSCRFGASAELLATEAARVSPVVAPRVVRPPKLELKVTMDDDDGDGALSAEERAWVICRVKNVGAGPATGVKVLIGHQPRGSWLSYEEEKVFDAIDIGEEVEFKAPLGITRDIPEGTASMEVRVLEANHYDADPFELRFATHAFYPPEFQVAQMTVFDGQDPKRFAFGNANGVVEPGESVEFTVKLQNSGKGSARDAVVKVGSSNPSVDVLSLNGKEVREMALGDLGPGVSRDLRISVLVKPLFLGGTDLPCYLEVTDSRAGLNQRIPFSVKVAKSASRRTVMDVAGSTTMTSSELGIAVKSVAVAHLVAQGVSANDAAIVSDWVRSAMVALNVFNVVDRSNMDKILREQALQQMGCTQQDCAVRLGRLLNVQRMIVGNYGMFEKSYVLNISVVNVETGQVVCTDMAIAPKDQGTEPLLKAINEMAARLAKRMY